MVPDRRWDTGRLAAALSTLLFLLALSACAALPPLQPKLAEPDPELPFPQGRWQLVHRIEARFPGNHKALMMGALELDSATGRLSCALMTVEGFTLFSAGFDPNAPAPLTITRAVPPFDGPGFAEGLMADLRLLFLAPKDTREATGTIDGAAVRRYYHHDGRITDVAALSNRRYSIGLYNADARLVRKAEVILPATARPLPHIAAKIFLEAMDDAGYTLKLDLVDAVPLGAASLAQPDGKAAKDFQ
jgi:hypothetical protein